MIAFDALGRDSERRPSVWRQRLLRCLEIGRGNDEIPGVTRQEAVEACGQLDEGLVSALLHGAQDRFDRMHDARIDLGRGALEHRCHGAQPEAPRVQDPDRGRGHRATATAGACRDRISSRSPVTAAYSVFMEARLTISRAVERVISATSTRPLARNVSPD